MRRTLPCLLCVGALAFPLLPDTRVALGADCNLNGREDADEVATGDAEDCNGDGYPDECDFVTRLTGGPSGPLPAAERSLLLAWGKINDDRFPDLVSLGGEQGSLSVWIALGGGTFSPEQIVAGCASASSMACADLDGDGLSEVALGCPLSSEVWIVSPLPPHDTKTVQLDFAPTALAAADLDLDGITDLVAAGSEGVALLRCDGESCATVLDSLAGTGTTEPDALIAADIDGDIFRDVVIADPERDLVTIIYGRDGPGLGDIVTVPLEGGPSAIVSLDMDLDGDLDLITVIRESRSLIRLEQLSREEFSASPIGASHDPMEAFSLSVGDLNGDAWTDLAVSGRASWDGNSILWSVRAYSGLPRGGFILAEDFYVGELHEEPERAPILVGPFFREDEALLLSGNPETPRVEVFFSETEGGGDENHDGILDACGERRFRRGDVDAAGSVEISDAIGILRYLFEGLTRLPCPRSADIDDNGLLEITDGIRLLRFLFLGGPTPVSPFPDCGSDPTEDDLSCLAYPLCD